MKPKIYLAGAMEFAPDVGADWREKASALLESKGFRFFNPCIDEGGTFAQHNFKNHDEFHAAKTADFKKFQKCMNEVARVDLVQVASAQYVLAYITPGLGGGTVGEMTAARYIFDTPVIAVLHPDTKLEKTSGWLLACCDKIFTDFETATSYIAQRYEDER